MSLPRFPRLKATPEVKAALDKAYKQINDAKSLKDLVPDIETHLKSLSKTLKVEDMVTRDLFNISVNKETEQYLKNGNSIKLSFQLGVKPNTKVVCMTLVDGKWTVIDQSKVKVNKDGTVTVEFTSAGPVAFAVQKTKTVAKTLSRASRS